MKISVIAALAKRNLLLYFRDKATVFFSLLTPLIVLLLYILFLGDVQTSSVLAGMPEGVPVSEKAVKGFVDSWMLAGVLGVGCMTVALNCMSVMVSDRKMKISDDYLTAPVPRSSVMLGYFFAFLAVTLIVNLLVYLIAILYLVACGTFTMSAADVFEGIGVLILSALSATMIMMFILSFFSSTDAVGAFSGIFSAAIGFLVGAFIPVSMMPDFVQYLICLVPGSYSAGLFRNVFMNGALENLAGGMPELMAELQKDFSIRMNFFGVDAGRGIMYGMLALSVAVFLVANLFRRRFAKAK